LSVSQYNGFEKTIVYAISLGGDTDTIATMAGAIAGAYYGIAAIPEGWRHACEGVAYAEDQAAKLFNLRSGCDPLSLAADHHVVDAQCTGDKSRDRVRGDAWEE
jgi:hypothetical protein